MKIVGKAALTIILAGIMVILPACGGVKITDTSAPSSGNSQCESDDDCHSAFAGSLGMCQQASCSNGFCRKISKINCCGNGIKETIEDERLGNKCTCPADHGKCEGSLKYKNAQNVEITSKYMSLGCSETNECVYKYDNSFQKSAEYFTTFSGTGFSFNIYIKYLNPFYRNESVFKVELKLNDLDRTMIDTNIIIKEIRLMESTNILRRANPNLTFMRVGDSKSVDISLSDYDMLYPEESKSVAVNLDYEYTPLRRTVHQDKTETYEKLEPERRSYQTTIRDRITFLDKSLGQI